MSRLLHSLVQSAAHRWPEQVAVSGPDGERTYAALDADANRLARALLAAGVEPGDRVGIWLDKGACAVACMQGVLRVGAAYVPLDPMSPAARILTIAGDCRMRAVLTTSERATELDRGTHDGLPALVRVAGRQPDAWAELPADPLPEPAVSPEELAYILYTSGSTGVPKGVCISHVNALAFIDWAVETLGVTPDDRLGNHAPFFFDLSVLDLYAAFAAGARVAILAEGASYNPTRLVAFLQSQALTIWYSVPSALILMMEQGGLLETPLPHLRAVLFAGEPFPVKHLRQLRDHHPEARYLNLYGPTETNVCTWFEVTSIDAGQTAPVPIGKASCGDRVYLAPLAPDDASHGSGDGLGELMVEGPTVMMGYWGRPPHEGPYGTGDVCRLRPDGNYEYVGRRDDMVKIRGRRIEPAEIEAVLAASEDLHEVAVVAAGAGLEAHLVAFVVAEGAGPSLLELKRRCAQRLPRYMVVDVVRKVEALPRTRNGKVDRRRLREWAESAAPAP